MNDNRERDREREREKEPNFGKTLQQHDVFAKIRGKPKKIAN